MARLIGRDKETAELTRLYNSDKAQLVAVYGRRRVGKTFLVDEFFKGRLTFRHAGLSPLNEGGDRNLLKEQLRHFYYSLQLHGARKSKCPTSWFDAFFMLEQLLESKDTGNKQVSSLTSCRGWTRRALTSSVRSRAFGTLGLAIVTTS